MTLEDEFLKSKTEEPQKKALSVKFGVKLKKVPPGAKLKDVKALFSGLSVKNVIFQRGAMAVVALGSQEAVEKALSMKNARLKNHAVIIRPLPQTSEATGKKNKGGEFKREFFPQRNQEEMEKEVEESGRLFLRNLSYEMSEADLDALCAPFGLLAEAFVPWDAAMGRNRGFGFVTFVHPTEAVRAFRSLDKKEVRGRKLHVLPGKEAVKEEEEEEEEDGGGDGKTSFQRERLAKRKRTEGTAAAERTWNPLLINATALAEVQAVELGVSKEKLLDSRTKGSAAVRLAQLELVLIGELEEFLKQENTHLPSLGSKEEEEGVVVRSRNAFLIKNLPAFSKHEELEPLLSRHGDLEALKMAPKGLLAIAHFRQSVQARRAFAHLAFAEFKDSVLKVEWLPQLQTEFAKEEAEAEDQEDQEASPPSKKAKIDEEASSRKKKKAKADEAEDDEKPQDSKKRKRSKEMAVESEDAEAEVSSKESKRKSEKANKMSKKASKKAEAKSSEEKAPSKESKKAGKSSKKAEAKSQKEKVPAKESKKAEKASKKAEAESEEKVPAKESKKTEAGRSATVVLVRNVPFQANEKELKELFRPFGSLARVRLPVKPGGGIRGFAFAEFADEESAQALLAADQRMHLYGRRLRLEAALTDTAVSSVRAKALASLTGSMEAEQQRKRKSKVRLEPELPPEAL